MDNKEKIVEILESWEKDNGHYFNSILESDYEDIAEEIVKLFAIPSVSLDEQSEATVCDTFCGETKKYGALEMCVECGRTRLKSKL